MALWLMVKINTADTPPNYLAIIHHPCVAEFSMESFSQKKAISNYERMY